MLKELKKLLSLLSPSRASGLLNSGHTHKKPLTEEDYAKIISEITSNIDSTNELGRRKAYIKCIDYAKTGALDVLDVNPFIGAAAKRFAQTQVVTGSMLYSIELTGKEKIFLTYSNQYGPEIVGNKDGLLYLARVLTKLAQSKMDGEHAHLYDGEEPLYGDSYPFTVYFEGDEWFKKYAVDDGSNATEDGYTDDDFKPNDIKTEDVAAFMLLDEAPPTILISPNKIYRVVSCRELDDENVRVWGKNGNAERAFIITFKRDDGAQEKIVLDADDEAVVFFKKESLEQL